MATRKPAKKAASKKSVKGALDAKKVRAGVVVLYGPPIWDAIRRGSLAEMKQLLPAARAHVESVKKALTSLDKAIASKVKF
jgi:hypothetical protein